MTVDGDHPAVRRHPEAIVVTLLGRRRREISLVAGVTARRKEVLVAGIGATVATAAIEVALGDATLHPVDGHR